MKNLTITNGFTRMSDAQLELRSGQILTAMTGNASFPTPTPTLTAVQDALTAFSAALYESRDGDRLKVAIKNQKREELIELLHQLSNFVLFKSAGDRVKAISSGFSIGKELAPTPPITTPQNLRVLQGKNPGELIQKIERVKGAVTYIFQYATDAMMAQDNWDDMPSSRTSCTIDGLQPGTKYNCRVVAIGRKEQMVYSDIVSRIVA